MKNQKLVMLKGLPASGKTSYAKQLVEDFHFKRVNKDDLRAMIDFSHWSSKSEKMIVKAQDSLIRLYLQEGCSVVVDDTNFNPKHEERFRNIAKEYDVKFEIENSFLDTSLQECIDRDLKREDKSVGRKVIENMYWKYVHKFPESIPYNPELPDCIICDVDGTLAIKSPERSPYEGLKVGLDTPRKEIFNLVKYLVKDDVKLFIFSGRENIKNSDDDISVWDFTYVWLKENGFENTPFYLILREAGDYRKDYVVKEEMYEKYIKNKYNVLYVVDDRPQVVKMWRRLGLITLDVTRDSEGVDF